MSLLENLPDRVRNPRGPILVVAMITLLSGILVADTKNDTHTLITPGKVAIEWYFSDTSGTWDKDVKPETRIWLEIRSFNERDWSKEGYNPSFSAIIVKDYKPVVRKLADGRWEITFASPLAEGLP